LDPVALGFLVDLALFATFGRPVVLRHLRRQAD
jgi:hypothetical protein